jgi:hypothetical protein
MARQGGKIKAFRHRAIRRGSYGVRRADAIGESALLGLGSYFRSRPKGDLRQLRAGRALLTQMRPSPARNEVALSIHCGHRSRFDGTAQKSGKSSCAPSAEFTAKRRAKSGCILFGRPAGVDRGGVKTSIDVESPRSASRCKRRSNNPSLKRPGVPVAPEQKIQLGGE